MAAWLETLKRCHSSPSPSESMLGQQKYGNCLRSHGNHDPVTSDLLFQLRLFSMIPWLKLPGRVPLKMHVANTLSE